MTKVMLDPNADNDPVAKPMFNDQCWGQKRNYTGSLFASFVNCSKLARKGFLTCHWHRNLNDAAMAKKERLIQKSIADCPVCGGKGYTETKVWADARYYSTALAAERVKCWKCKS